MSNLTESPRDMVNKTFDQGKGLDASDKDAVPGNREDMDKTPADHDSVAMGDKSVDGDMANKADAENNDGKV